MGHIDTLQLAVPSAASLDFWEQRLDGRPSARAKTLRFEDYDGLRLELVVAPPFGDPPLDRRSTRTSRPSTPSPGLARRARVQRLYEHVEEKVLTDVLGFTYEGDGEYVLDGS